MNSVDEVAPAFSRGRERARSRPGYWMEKTDNFLPSRLELDIVFSE
jgi:hypothetical protein